MVLQNHSYYIPPSTESKQGVRLYVAPVADVHELPTRKPKVLASQLALTGLVVFAILFGCVQGVRSAATSAVKLERLVSQLSTVKAVHHEAVKSNQVLTNQINTYRSPTGMEELARDGLELVRNDEILVRLHHEQASPVVASF
ncbi:MAG: hypothetical protein KC475_02725 [Cyanobacteria bacterium HKST-UBA03]|nr:hypothetical protein [Cyanobacteria bacterium HKST-UBA03]